MEYAMTWWRNELPIRVKFVLLVLLANGLPAFIILMTLPTFTEVLFVWTIKPVINARLVGVMYSNALLLVFFAALQTSWARVRVNMVIITLFSLFATLLTFFYLDPFLAHPWYHLAYWLTMYLVLFFAAPVVFTAEEQAHGGRLPVTLPLNLPARIFAVAGAVVSLVVGLGLIYQVETVNQYWPWTMPPLVGGLIGVLFTTHAAAYAWSLWDGDWLRVRPMYWQAPITGVLLILLPLTHSGDLRPDSGAARLLFYGLATAFTVAGALIIAAYRTGEQQVANDGT